MVAGSWYLSWVVKKAVNNGESFSLPQKESAALIKKEKASEASVGIMSKVPETVVDEPFQQDLPNVVFAFLPLVSVIIILNTLSNYMSATGAALISLSSGIIIAWILMFKHASGYWAVLGKGTHDALEAAANTCAVVGFGSVAAKVPAFTLFVNALLNLPGPPYMGLAIAVTLICGITGSASGGLGIALPILAPIYMAQGLDPGAMHRISALASGGLDSLPHNGYVVTTIRAICGETHKRSYKDVFVVSIVIPTVVLLVAVFLYSVFL